MTTGTLPRNDRTAISETILRSRFLRERSAFPFPDIPVVDDIRWIVSTIHSRELIVTRYRRKSVG